MTALAAAALAVPAAVAAALLLVRDRPSVQPPSRRGRPTGARDEQLLLRVLTTAAVGVGLLVLVGGRAGALAALVAAGGCWWVVGGLEPPSVRRRRERLTAAVPHGVDLLAACLSVGLAPGSALEQIAGAVEAPLSEEFAAITSRLRLGVDPATVWHDVARHPQLGGLGRAVSRATESGASVSDAMLRLADDLRRRTRAETENRARAVGVKAALPLGLCLLPAFVLIGVVPLVVGSLSVLLGH